MANNNQFWSIGIGEIIDQLTDTHNQLLMVIKHTNIHLIVKEVVSHSSKLWNIYLL